MATVPAPQTWTSGQVLTASAMNLDVRDAGLFWTTNRPMFHARQTVAQTLTTAVYGSITFSTEDLDRDGGHDTSVNTSRYTSQTAGWYLCAGSVGFAGNNAGRRGARWAVNGTAVNGSLIIVANAGVGTCQVPVVTRLISLGVGDYVEIQGIQESGGNLNTAVSAENQSTMTVVWMGS